MRSPAKSAPANARKPCAAIASCSASACSAKACCRAKRPFREFIKAAPPPGAAFLLGARAQRLAALGCPMLLAAFLFCLRPLGSAQKGGRGERKYRSGDGAGSGLAHL